MSLDDLGNLIACASSLFSCTMVDFCAIKWRSISFWLISLWYSYSSLILTCEHVISNVALTATLGLPARPSNRRRSSPRGRRVVSPSNLARSSRPCGAALRTRLDWPDHSPNVATSLSTVHQRISSLKKPKQCQLHCDLTWYFCLVELKRTCNNSAKFSLYFNTPNSRASFLLLSMNEFHTDGIDGNLSEFAASTSVCNSTTNAGPDSDFWLSRLISILSKIWCKNWRVSPILVVFILGLTYAFAQLRHLFAIFEQQFFVGDATQIL